MWDEEKMLIPAFSPFPTMFQKLSFSVSLKSVLCGTDLMDGKLCSPSVDSMQFAFFVRTDSKSSQVTLSMYSEIPLLHEDPQFF